MKNFGESVININFFKIMIIKEFIIYFYLFDVFLMDGNYIYKILNIKY